MASSSRARTADLRKSGGEADYRPPAAVAEYFAELDAEGKQAIEKAAWWRELLAQEDLVHNWPSHAKRLEQNDHQHRESAPLHFVMGRLAPYYIERCYKRDCSRAVWAVYLGPYCSNGDTTMGVGQGGAISSLFDLITAQLGSMFAQARTPTVRIAVDLKKPAVPIPGVFKCEAFVEKEENNRIYLRGEFGNGKDVFATCQVTLARVVKKSKL